MIFTSAFVVSALALLAVARPEPYYPYYVGPPVTTTITVTATPQPVNQCTTGNTQCCNSVQSSNSMAASALLGLLGVVIQGVEANIGIGCNAVSVLGTAVASSCNAQVVCCDNTNFNGLIAIGCNPINIA